MISKVGWTATPVTSYVAKQSPHKRSFFFCVYRISIHVLSMLFSNRRIKKSELFYSDFTFHILPYPSIILGGFHHFLSPHQHPGPGPVRPCPCWRTTGPQTPWIPTGCGSAWRARSQLIEIRATNHWEYDHWDILGRSLGIFTPISQMISQWYSHTKHFNGNIMGYFNGLLTTYESCACPRRTWWAALHHGICWDIGVKQQHGSFFLGPACGFRGIGS